MNLSEKTQLNLLEGSQTNNLDSIPFDLTPIEMANLYTNSALLVTIMGFLKEQLWLQNKEDNKTGNKTSYRDFILPLFKKELVPVIFLKSYLLESGAKNIKNVTKNSEVIEEKVISLIIEKSFKNQKDFIIQSLSNMKELFIREETEDQGLRLYRTFDKLDDIFNLDYEQDKILIVDPFNKERLYEGAGVGVQSGYSTILLALENIDLSEKSRIIDLGSGYGRVGLVCSLMRPDINFTGYEYVPHRVKLSNKTSESLDLEKTLKFITQDLSLNSFKIPDADVYYLYDPFTKDTYESVLKQIVEISKRKKITVVTKGNASNWLNEIANDNNWSKPVYIDDGNLCIFKSCD